MGSAMRSTRKRIGDLVPSQSSAATSLPKVSPQRRVRKVGDVMASYRKRALALAAVASMSVVGLTACGGGSSNAGGKGGGTLTYYVRSVYEHTDPQRSYLGVEMTN